ncbi:hypothetical protein INS49_007254 [Diaporthe citri]|uniref:uncharacterized protein n=1 Tax=Diaporthe citri TaxID=83186 RepID=UPI001C811633|nr:uncharacterized protein INS49_007254 [Diaporthe citri]KAG6365643.1 hypothetical protein INS49_007254 [Diaporthe citri]
MSASVQHGGKAFEKSGAAPPVVIAMPDDESHVGADDKVKKEARLTKYAKGLNYFLIVKYLVFLLAMIGIIVLALQVSKDQDAIQKLNHEMGTAPRAHNAALEDHIGGRMSYLEGFSGMVNDDDTALLAARDVMVSGDPSTATSTAVSTSMSTVASTIAPSVGETSATETCSTTTDTDTTVNVLKTTTTFLSTLSSTTATEEETTTSDTTQTTLHTQLTTTVFSNATGTSVFSAAAVSSLATGTSLFSVDPLSASMESSMAATTTVPATAPMTSGLVPNNPSHCLEYGDGAGPCNRPYGAPNTPPSSITLSVGSATTSYPPPSLSVIPSTSPSIPGGVIPSATTSDTTTLGATTSDTGAMSGTTTSTSSIISVVDTSTVSGTETTISSTISDMDTSVCGPPTTVYVTLSSSADTLSVEGGVTIASFGTTTASSPSTVTSTSTSLAQTITVSLASATETVHNSSATTTSHLLTASGITLTLTAHGNGTYKPTTTGPSTVVTLPATAGGEKAAGGKPMGASGNGGTGNGMYCVVMLVTLLALLI